MEKIKQSQLLNLHLNKNRKTTAFHQNNKNRNITVFHQNTDRINNKIERLNHLLESIDPDIKSLLMFHD